MKNRWVFLWLAIAFSAVEQLNAQQMLPLDTLLENVRAGRVQDAKESISRVSRFNESKTEKLKTLSVAKATYAREENLSQTLEVIFTENGGKLLELEAKLKNRIGSLEKLSTILEQTADSTRGQFENSLTQIHFPDRVDFLKNLAQKMSETTHLATLKEMRHLWFELQREMTESGKIIRFTTKVVATDGAEVEREVVRIGTFNVISNGKYLRFVSETKRLVELPRQPKRRYTDMARNLQSTTQKITAFGVDPSRGQILSLLVQTPSLTERIRQGGIIGYVIISLGAFGLLIGLERIAALSFLGIRVRAQMDSPDEPGDNPLGRVFKVYSENPEANLETLELRLSEAILRETPAINRTLMFLKIIAVVAPLLGLLGTVTGMIVTFQAITLFGTGDPKLMAGGISQALVTTVLGLCAAIPIILLHALASNRARQINQILEEQATGIIAIRSEIYQGKTA